MNKRTRTGRVCRLFEMKTTRDLLATTFSIETCWEQMKRWIEKENASRFDDTLRGRLWLTDDRT